MSHDSFAPRKLRGPKDNVDGAIVDMDGEQAT